MNENIALILSLLVIVVSISTVLFFKHKYSKQLPPIIEQDNKQITILKDDFFKNETSYLEKIKELELIQVTITEDKRIALDKISEQEKIIADKEILIFNALNVTKKEDLVVENVSIDKIEEKTVKSILVVDDSMVVRNKMKKLLLNAGYEITTANDGLEALNALTTKKFSLIITDLEMPNLDGFGLIMKLDANPETKGLPIMAITGHEEMKIKVSQCSGLYSIHKKPWKDKEILKKVELLSSINLEKE